MKRQKAIAVLGALALLTTGQLVHAKEKWVKCGVYEIALDEDKERYSVNLLIEMKQGRATFFPSQINFKWYNMGSPGSAIWSTQEFAIDRKTLNYTMKHVMGSPSSSKVLEEQSGKCSAIQPPTSGNKI